MSKLQITLPGRRLDDGSNQRPLESIQIDLDNQDGKFGKAITFNVYQEMVNRFCTMPDIRNNEKIFFTIDKQLLHILLASTKCHSLALSKCIRKDGNESIAFCALDKEGKILGTSVNPLTQVVEQSDPSSDISSGEWVQGLTRDEAIDQGVIAENPIGESFFDFSKYLSILRIKLTNKFR